MEENIKEIRKSKYMKLDMDKLIDLALEQQNKINEIRGYIGDIKRKDLEDFEKDVLVDCYLWNQDKYGFEDEIDL